MPRKINQLHVLEDLLAEADTELAAMEKQAYRGIFAAFRRAVGDMRVRVMQEFNALGTETWELDQMVAANRLLPLIQDMSARVGELAQEIGGTIYDSWLKQYQEATLRTGWAIDQATPDVYTASIPMPIVRSMAADAMLGARFSARIGMISDFAAAGIKRELMQSVINGESMRDAAGRIVPILGAQYDAPQNYMARAMTIARTELMNASNQGRLDTFKANPEIMDGDAEKAWEWVVTSDDRLCDECLEMEGKTGKDGIDPPPLHPNCLLPGNLIVAPGTIAAAKSKYVGGAIEMRFADGCKLTVTDNHPIATPDGWVAANHLRKGDDVIRCRPTEGKIKSIDPDYNHRPAVIEQVVSALEKSFGVSARSVKSSPEYFHGDGRSIHGDIKIITSNSFLRSNRKAGFLEPFRHLFFGGIDFSNAFNALRFFGQVLFASLAPSYGVMGGSCKACALCGGSLAHAYKHRSRAITLDAADRSKAADNNAARNSVNLRKFFDGAPGKMTIDKIASIKPLNFSGHVYDLQCVSGLYAAGIPKVNNNMVLVSNCRCTMTPALKSWADIGSEYGIDLSDMPENWGDDVRGMRDEKTGKWEIQSVETYNQWISDRKEAAGMVA